jgi:hypothetical protein
VIGAAIWRHAAAETEPPAWDALSYAAKAFNFWDAIARGRIFNPLDLQPIVRPPGTILMSYPFGFSHAFQAFYFRSIYIPIVLLAAATYVACHKRDPDRRAPWTVAVMALTVCGTPILYQFQSSQIVASANSWGLVDSFIGAVAAIAMAAAVRSVRDRSATWAIGAALAAALCLMIKPSGFLVMPLVGMTWIILIGSAVGWKIGIIWKEPALRRLVAIGSACATIIFAMSAILAWTSAYLSPDSLNWGSRALAVLHLDFSRALDMTIVRHVIELAFGYVVPVVVGVGLILASITRGNRGELLAAMLCLVVGCWFWLIETSLDQIRYFLPFGFMAFVLVAPSLTHLIQRLPALVRVVLSLVMISPTVAVTVLSLVQEPPLAWQRALNVNLMSGAFRAENRQAADFLAMVQNEGPRTLYMVTIDPISRNFSAVVDYWTYFDPWRVRTSIKIPVDWVRPSTFRLNEIKAADYLLFEPVTTEGNRESLLRSNAPADFFAETQLMRAWFSTLGAHDGVAVVSESRLRLLRVVDHQRLGRSLDQLRDAYDWRPVFREANP